MTSKQRFIKQSEDTIDVNLTSNNSEQIYDLYLKLSPKNLCNYVFTDKNEFISSSTTSFNKGEKTENLLGNIE